MKLNTRKEKGWFILTVEGRVDTSTAPQLDQDLDAYVQVGHRNFLFDFSQLDYISSCGFRSLVALSKKLGKDKGHIAVCGLHGVTEEAFRLSGFIALMPVYKDVDDAPALP
jgi:anti-anti-sigma factor